MTQPIVLYDIPSKDRQPVSPNTWKVRYALNYKGLPHRTEFIEYSDIESTLQKLDAPFTTRWPDGRPYYTLPMIYDPNTQTRLVDSPAIAKYLDTAYPDTPQLFPSGTDALQAAALDVIIPNIALPLYKSIINSYSKVFDARAQAHLAATRPGLLGAPMEELATPEQWDALVAGLGQLKGWLEKNGPGKEGLFLVATISFVDLQVAALLRWARIGDADLWERIVALHDGKWKKYLERFQEYEQIHI